MKTVTDSIQCLREHEFCFGTRRKAAKPRTILYYEERTAALLKSWPDLGLTPLRHVTADQCERWAKTVSKTMSAPAFNNTLMILRNSFKLAIREGALKTDPTSGIRRMTAKSELPDLPTRDQFNELLRVLDTAVHATAKPVADLVRVMAYSGIRLREATGLEWRDVEFENGLLWIHRQRDKDGLVVSTKNGQKRFVELNPSLRAVLEKMKADSPNAEPTDRITAIDSCQGALDHACVVAKCPRITHHDLRHLFITACVESGVDFRTIAEWVGHQDGGVLIGKTYSHLRRDHSQRMGAKVTF